MSYLKSLGTGFVWICTVLAVITFIPGLPPNINTTPYNVKEPMALNKERNDRLNNPEKLFNGEIHGPESFDIYDGILYTGLHGGAVSKIVDNKIIEIVKFGKKCDGIYEEEKCGRPLGLKFDKYGKLFVIDTYYGIFKVDIKTKKYEKIIDLNKPIDDKIPFAANGIDIASNGDIYWTDSSTDFKMNDVVYAFFADPSGRLIRYNAATKKNEVLLKNLGFVNGVKLSDDESFLVISETMTSTILKYFIKGTKAGKSEILIDGLPGLPDNIHSDGQGNFIVSLPTLVDEDHPFIGHTLAPHSNLRKMVLRLLGIIEAPFKLFEQVYPNIYTKSIINYIGHYESAQGTTESDVTVIRFDGNGNILDILNNNDEKLSTISSAIIKDNYLYLGSPVNKFIARVPLEKAFPGFKKVEKIVPTKKPVTTTKKPVTTTTTPKPTTTTTTTSKPTTTTTTTTTQKPTTTTPKPKPATTTTTQKPTVVPTIKPVVENVNEKIKNTIKTPPKPVKNTKQADVKPVKEKIPEAKTQQKKTIRDEM